jgi:hypothetical protein
MKKLIISILCILAGATVLIGAARQRPNMGHAQPLQLGDADTRRAGQLTRGAIMKAIVDNNPANILADPKLMQANMAIAAFDKRGQNFNTYDVILENIRQSTKAHEAIAAVQAFETVIMHLYDYDTYAYGSYAPWQSIFVTGVRYRSVFKDSDKLKALIDELEILSDVVGVHSTRESLRLKATVHSYRHWRRNLAIACAAHLMLDAYVNGADKSLVNQFYHKGLSDPIGMSKNHFKNSWFYAKGTGKLVKGTLTGSWNYVIYPIGKFCFGGKAAFEEKPKQVAKKQASSTKPDALSTKRTDPFINEF